MTSKTCGFPSAHEKWLSWSSGAVSSEKLHAHILAVSPCRWERSSLSVSRRALHVDICGQGVPKLLFYGFALGLRGVGVPDFRSYGVSLTMLTFGVKTTAFLGASLQPNCFMGHVTRFLHGRPRWDFLLIGMVLKSRSFVVRWLVAPRQILNPSGLQKVRTFIEFAAP